MPSMLFGDNGIFNQSQYNPNAVQATPGVVNPAGFQGLQSTAQLLGQQVNGGGPNLAGAQLAAAQDASARQALALAASTRGNQNPGMALYASQNALAQGNQAAAGTAAQARLAQQLGAEGMLSGVYGQEGQLGLGQAQLAQQASESNAAAQNALIQQKNAGIIGASGAAQAENQALLSGGVNALTTGLLPANSQGGAQGGISNGLSSLAGGAALFAKGGIADGPTAIAGEDGKEAVIPLERGGHQMVHVPHSAIQALAAGIADLSARIGKLEGSAPKADVAKELGKAKGKVVPFKKAA